MTDPSKIEIDEAATYVRINGYGNGVGSIPHPLKADTPRKWKGHKQDTPDDDQLTVDKVSRGGWGFLYVATDDEELIDALEGEGHEPITPDEFAMLLDDAPGFTYLRTPTERTAKKAEKKHQKLSVVDPEEIIELEASR